MKSQVYLGAGDSPVVAAAAVAVLVPPASIQSHQLPDHAGPPRHCSTEQKLNYESLQSQ